MTIIKDHPEDLDNKSLDAISSNITDLQVNTLLTLLEISIEYCVDPNTIIDTFIDGLTKLQVLALSDLPD